MRDSLGRNASHRQALESLAQKESLAIQVVDTVYDAAGATAVYEGHLLQRAFQDMHVISQHAQSRHAHYELVGRYWLGLPIDEGRLWAATEELA